MRDVLVTVGPLAVLWGAAFALGFLCGMAAWVGHTEQSRILAAAVEAGADATGKIAMVAADIYGSKPEVARVELFRALTTGQPLNLWRLGTLLGGPFWPTFCDHIAAQYGARLLRAEELTLLRAAVRLGSTEHGRAQMARMDLWTPDAERRQA